MKELIYPRMFFPAARDFAGKTPIIDGPYRATQAEHAERVLRLAHALARRLGIERGDRFAVLAKNSHAFIELYHAAFLGAGVINPLNLRLAPRELGYILRDSGTRVAFVDATFAPLLHQPMELGEESQTGRHHRRGGDHRPRPAEYRRIQGPQVGRAPRPAPAAVRRPEGAQAGAPGALLEGARARDQLSPVAARIRLAVRRRVG